MTLYQMSFSYRAEEKRLDARITALRVAARETKKWAEAERYRQRIAALKVLRRQLREMAELTNHYYERGYHRNERYTL